MTFLKKRIQRIIIASLLVIMILPTAIAGIAFSGESMNSLSISSTRSENSYQYLLEIDIEGIATSKVTFETDFQTLYLSAESGGIVSNGAIAGAQVISLVFNFPANANLKNYLRVNKPNRIIISVPKS